MALPNTFARRKLLASGQTRDVFEYDTLPLRLRGQITLIIEAGIGYYSKGNNAEQDKVYARVLQLIGEERGKPFKNSRTWPGVDVHDWLSSESDLDLYLTGVEECLRRIDTQIRAHPGWYTVTKSPDVAIDHFNGRCMEAGFGYQYVGGEIIRMDSQLLHSEVVVPALDLLSYPVLQSANEEYRRAHKAFRESDYEPCLIECGKAFESVLKVIGSKRGWGISENDTASKLIDAAVKANFLASYQQAGFTSLRAMLESGVPVPRNKSAGHGAGVTPRTVPVELAAFQLHQTAAVIVFLVESDAAQP